MFGFICNFKFSFLKKEDLFIGCVFFRNGTIVLTPLKQKRNLINVVKKNDDYLILFIYFLIALDKNQLKTFELILFPVKLKTNTAKVNNNIRMISFIVRTTNSINCNCHFFTHFIARKNFFVAVCS